MDRRPLLLLPLLPLLGACPDYGFKPIEEPSEDTADEGAPDIAADPAALDLGVLCELGVGTVTVLNQGDAPLTLISVSVLGSWDVVAPGLPLTLDPGGSLALSVGGEGEGTLLLESDDPDTPELSVPLSGTSDQPPTVSIDLPIDGAVLDPGAITTFQATVSDDVDAADALRLAWSSDVAGLLGGSPADSAGLATLSWDAAAVASGAHTVTLDVTDSCGLSASDTVTICQNEGYVEASVDLVSWHFEGTALWDSTNSWVQLTDTGTNQAGTAFQTASTVDANNVNIQFSFYVSGGSGADGMSLTALDTTRMSTYVGSTGGGIGYGGLPGWSLEVDTWYNAEASLPGR